MTDDSSKPLPAPRIDLIDVLRGIALVAMAIYHFTWDLEYFGWLPPATMNQTGWVIFARCIAGSFLFLVGASMVLAHENDIRWRSFGKRFMQVAGAATLISLVTYYAIPGGFIFFGILHGIALFSVLGLAFVRLHWSVSLVGALAVLGVWQSFSHEIFFHPSLWWVGLAPVPPPSNDYVPVFPWFAPILLGIAAGKLTGLFNLRERLAKIFLPSPVQKPMSFIGRRSLVFYLIHQPLLMAMIWAFTAVAGEPDKAPVFTYQCQKQCERSNGTLFCTPYCSCMVEGLKEKKLFAPFIDRNMSTKQNADLLALRDDCVAMQQ